jgi:hypothetical protein
MSAFATLISFLLSIKTPLVAVIISVAIIIIAVGYAYYQVRPINNLTLNIHDALKVTIEDGDLFKQRKNSVIVIPVNEYYDTIVDNKIIAHKTIHGIFIENYFQNRLDELNEKIQKALLEYKDFAVFNKERKRGNSYKYPLGTCIMIQEGGNEYILWAFTHFDEHDHAYIDLEEFESAFKGLTQTIQYIANNRPVYMPLFGSGQSGINKTPQRILGYILHSLEFNHTTFIVPQGVHIVIKDLRKKGINLTHIKKMWHYSFVGAK